MADLNSEPHHRSHSCTELSSRPGATRPALARVILLALWLSSFTWIPAVFGQAPTNARPVTGTPVLRVMARDVEPFCFEKNGRRTGFAVDLWDEIAKEAGFQYNIQTAD